MTEAFLIAGAIPSLLLGVIGVVNGFIMLNNSYEYDMCYAIQALLGNTEHLLFALRSMAVFSFGFVLVEMALVFRIWKFFYLIGGIVMFVVLLAGLTFTIIVIVYYSSSNCTSTAYG